MSFYFTHIRRYSFIVIIAFILGGCSSRELPQIEQAFQIPQLKPRHATLSPAEFATYRGKYDELTKKIVAEPGSPDAYVQMAQLFMNEARISGDHPYYYPAALKLLDRAIDIDANNFGALISLGSIQLSLHQFKDAAITGKKAIAIAPYSNYPWGILCDASLELGDYKTAVLAADSMVSIRPDLRSYARVSYLREVHGDINGAIEAMEMAVKAGVPGREEKAWARNTLGNMYLDQGKLKEAEMQFASALAERPNYAFALGGIARVRAAQKSYDAALMLLDSASDLVPEFSFVQLKADILHVQGKLQDEATTIAAIETMLAEDEASGHAMDREFAMLYATRGIKTEKAEAYAHKEYQKRPDNVSAAFSLAIACFRAGKLDEADGYMKRILAMNSNNAEQLAYSGLITSAKGNVDAGKVLLTKALKINPYLNPLLLAEVKAALKT
jgi:tetratricopeptide (TPR) repeat protein